MIDLRSDTVTQPTAEMRQAMANAPVGDDVYQDDPTVNKLEQLAAQMSGKEAAIFVPSGTMGNQLAIMSHTNRGDEIILGQNSHIVVHEVGATAILSNVNLLTINNEDHMLTKEDILANIRVDDIHHPKTSLVCIENALGNGTTVPLNKMQGVYEAANSHNIPVHLDGARLFNASTYLGVDAKEITKYCDSVMFCVSKGLCAPIGSLLCGDKAFIKKSRKFRKLLGGGMRQAGIIASAGIIGLEKMTKRLHIDHENALYLANSLNELPNISVDISKVQINIVFFQLKNKTDKPLNTSDFISFMKDKGIIIGSAYSEKQNLFRFVTHNGITKENINYVINTIKSY